MASFRKSTVWGFALVAILLLFMLFPVQADPVPYSKWQMQHNYASANEPFSVNDLVQQSEMMSQSANVKSKPMSLENFHFLGMGGNANVTASSSSFENFEPNADSSKTLYPGSLQDSNVIDQFSHITQNGIDGQNGCVSAGLTNSGGYICLTPALIQLMKTRGGNATGQDSQIGAPSSK